MVKKNSGTNNGSLNIIIKVGYYTIFEKRTPNKTTYIADSGKLIYIERFKKYLPNKNRDVKEFISIEKAKEYAGLKIVQQSQKKAKKIALLPKSLYLVLIKEEQTGNTFVKVGITSKRFIMRRFSKAYGYEGYTIESILRRIESPNAEKLESNIKDKLYKKRSVKKYRPLLKSFSGYSECFNYDCLNDIIKIFDELVTSGS